MNIGLLFIIFSIISCGNQQNNEIKGYYYFWYSDSNFKNPDYRELQIDENHFFNLSYAWGFSPSSKYSYSGGSSITIQPHGEADTFSYRVIKNTTSFLKLVTNDNTETLVLYKMKAPAIDIKDAMKAGKAELFGEQVEFRKEKLYKKHFIDSDDVQLSGPLN